MRSYDRRELVPDVDIHPHIRGIPNSFQDKKGISVGCEIGTRVERGRVYMNQCFSEKVRTLQHLNVQLHVPEQS